jgi:hypothetical protein
MVTAEAVVHSEMFRHTGVGQPERSRERPIKTATIEYDFERNPVGQQTAQRILLIDWRNNGLTHGGTQ